MGFPRFLSVLFLVRNKPGVLPTSTTISSMRDLRSRTAGCFSTKSDNDNQKQTEAVASKNTSTQYVLSPVQSTSLLVAYWRDVESRRQRDHNNNSSNKNPQKDPLIVDPTAQILLEALLSPSQRQSYDSSPIRPYGIECLAVRTRAMDDWLLRMMTTTKDQNRVDHENDDVNERIQKRKLVNLGAGMCGRPYRMDNLSSFLHSWWEVDSDLELLQVKRSALKASGCFDNNPQVPIVDVSIDLSCPQTSLAERLQAQPDWWSGTNSAAADNDDDDADSEKNDNKTRTTSTIDWIAEGLFAYLEPDQHTKVFRETASISARGSRMAITVAEPAMSNFWESLGVTLPYQVLVPIDDILGKAKDSGWIVDRHIQPHDWSQLYPGRGEELPGYHVVFFERD